MKKVYYNDNNQYLEQDQIQTNADTKYTNEDRYDTSKYETLATIPEFNYYTIADNIDNLDNIDDVSTHIHRKALPDYECLSYIDYKGHRNKISQAVNYANYLGNFNIYDKSQYVIKNKKPIHIKNIKRDIDFELSQPVKGTSGPVTKGRMKEKLQHRIFNRRKPDLVDSNDYTHSQIKDTVISSVYETNSKDTILKKLDYYNPIILGGTTILENNRYYQDNLKNKLDLIDRKIKTGSINPEELNETNTSTLTTSKLNVKSYANTSIKYKDDKATYQKKNKSVNLSYSLPKEKVIVGNLTNSIELGNIMKKYVTNNEYKQNIKEVSKSYDSKFNIFNENKNNKSQVEEKLEEFNYYDMNDVNTLKLSSNHSMSVSPTNLRYKSQNIINEKELNDSINKNLKKVYLKHVSYNNEKKNNSRLLNKSVEKEKIIKKTDTNELKNLKKKYLDPLFRSKINHKAEEIYQKNKHALWDSNTDGFSFDNFVKDVMSNSQQYDENPHLWKFHKKITTLDDMIQEQKQDISGCLHLSNAFKVLKVQIETEDKKEIANSNV